MSAPALLQTKLYLPAARSSAVDRPRLIQSVLQGLRSRLTLVVAPAGFGKSTLLAQTLRLLPSELSGVQIATVSLDPADNDAMRFWTYVCAALEQACPALGNEASTQLRASAEPIEPVLIALLNHIAMLDTPIVLVLDDYHVINNAQLVHAMSFLLDNAPAQLRVLIASRIDPVLPLARWRVRGQLHELRASDLRFRLEEAEQFFDATMGLALDKPVVAELEQRTEGWAAGLQLAALSLHGQHDIAGFVSHFNGSHRHVMDYLGEEVLDRLSPELRRFVLHSAILDRLQADLCDAVIGQNNAASCLAELDRQNIFVIPLDYQRQWYRYHHLFVDLLRHRLSYESAELVPILHQRAAHWYQQHGLLDEALNHAWLSHNSELFLGLLEQQVFHLVTRGESLTLKEWLERVSADQLIARPRLGLAKVWMLLTRRQFAQISDLLSQLEPVLQADTPLRGELLCLQAHTAIEHGLFAQAMQLAQAGLALVGDEERWVRSHLHLVLAYAQMVLGYGDAAIQSNYRAIDDARQGLNALSGVLSVTEIVKISVLQGRFAQAIQFYNQSLEWITQFGWQQVAMGRALYAWYGHIFLEQGDYEQAEQAYQLSAQLPEYSPGLTAARSNIAIARLRFLQGKPYHDILQQLEQLVQTWHPNGERCFFESYAVRIHWLAGDHDWCAHWLSQRVPWQPGETLNFFRMLELVAMARVQGPASLPMLFAIIEQCQQDNWVILQIETQLLVALYSPQHAMDALAQACDLALPSRIITPFVELQTLLAPQLERYLSSLAPNHAYRHLLGGYQANISMPTALSEPLSERELEILRLYAAGMSNGEIAAHLVLSVNTIKTHLKNIYGKFATHSRHETIARARELGIIP
jgi:LuxR family maltose regulon positive regulatory protein